MTERYGVSNFRVILQAGSSGSQTNHELVHVDADFAINTIPQASCVLAVGREVRGGKAASAHQSGHQWDLLQEAEIFLEAKGRFSDTEDWPGGQQRIFKGYITGQGYRKQKDNVALTVNLVHWLADLQFSSSLSESSHPSNPMDYTFPGAIALDSGSGGQGGSAILGQLDAEGTLNEGTIASDFWAKALLPTLLKICEKDQMLQISGHLSDCGVGADGRKNDLAVAALNRIATAGGRGGWSVPALSLNLQGADASLATDIQRCVKMTLSDPALMQSIWDNLVGSIGPEFLFSIVPLVDTALVVPLAPYQEPYKRIIKSTDQDFVQLSAMISRPLRGVGIMHGNSFPTMDGANQMDSHFAPDTGIGGCYFPAGQEKGTILVQPAPCWLSNLASSGNPDETVGPNSSTTPGADGPSLKTPSQIYREAGQIFKAYARAIYITEALRGRAGMVAGKLRFDLAPGSTVTLEGTAEKFLGASDQLGVNVVGQISRVSFGIDSEQGQASTSYQLQCLRTEAENKEERFSVAEHPIYNTKFIGAPLVDAYAMT